MSGVPILRRIAEQGRAPVAFVLDGVAVTALQGDTVLTAILTQHERLRETEFSGAARAGFCLMGACQDCWVRTGAGASIRACSSFIAPGMRLFTRSPGDRPSLPATDPWPPEGGR